MSTTMRVILPVLLFFSNFIAATRPSPAIALENCGPVMAGKSGFQDETLIPPEFEQKVVEVLNEFGIMAGMAIGIVKGDEVIYARGFGFRDLETCAPVTPNTGFYLFSTTKSFTGMTAALLQEEGIFEIDQSLSHYFPDLEMPEGINPAQITIRDLLTHGKPFLNGAINYRTFAPGNLPDEDLLEVLATYSEPKAPTFQYSNTAFIIAAHAMKAATGKGWRQLYKERIFQPLGMKNSYTHIQEAIAGEFAFPYFLDEDGHMVDGFLKTENQMNAAGGIVSTVNDLNRWLIANLNFGWVDGKQVFPRYAVRQAQVPQIQYNWLYYKFRRFGYGLGVHNADYEGDLLIHHFGGAIHVSFMPEHHLGVVVLSSDNRNGSILTHRIAALTYDMLLDKQDLETRWENEMADARESLEEQRQQRELAAAQNLAQANPEDPTVASDSLTGRYYSPRLGEIVIEERGSRLVLAYGDIETPFERLDGDSFLASMVPLDGAPRSVIDAREDTERGFVLDWDGRIFVRQ